MEDFGMITWLDYVPISIESFPFSYYTLFWILTSSLLTNPHYKEQLSKELLSLFQLNSPDVDNTIVWNTHEVFIWGLFIIFDVYVNNKKTWETSELLAQMCTLEKQHNKKA